MRKLAVLTVVLLGSLAGVASAATHKPYVLRHPTREHCKAHYVKKVQTVKVKEHHTTVKVKETLCVYKAPQVAHPTPPVAPSLTGTITVVSYGYSTALSHHTVSGSVSVLAGTDLIGVPITYTITNKSTGQALGSFTEPSDPLQPCAIVYTVENNTQTFVGEAGGGDAACPLAAVSMPTGQIPVLTGSFAGNSAYGPSVSQEVVI
jgi:hypothetical protein